MLLSQIYLLFGWSSMLPRQKHEFLPWNGRLCGRIWSFSGLGFAAASRCSFFRPEEGPVEAERRIKQVMAEVLEVDPGAIGVEFQREEAPSWDSMAHLRLVSALEETFGIRFTMREVGEMERFETIRRLVLERLPA
jgi:acyl carrier protein